MTLFLVLAAGWGILFLLALALAQINSRPSVVSDVNFQVNPVFFQPQDNDMAPLGQLVTSKLRSPTERRARRMAGAKETIFVVDDDEEILKLITHVLEIEGFEVKGFSDPEEALHEFESTRRRPQMMVTDYCMAPMNGLELISRCRQVAPELKTVVISGMVDEDDLAKAPAKMDRFIHKPFKVSSLVQTLNETLAHN